MWDRLSYTIFLQLPQTRTVSRYLPTPNIDWQDRYKHVQTNWCHLVHTIVMDRTLFAAITNYARRSSHSLFNYTVSTMSCIIHRSSDDRSTSPVGRGRDAGRPSANLSPTSRLIIHLECGFCRGVTEAASMRSESVSLTSTIDDPGLHPRPSPTLRR